MPRSVVERAPEAEPRRFHVLSAKLTDTLEAAQDAERDQNHH